MENIERYQVKHDQLTSSLIKNVKIKVYGCHCSKHENPSWLHCIGGAVIAAARIAPFSMTFMKNSRTFE